MNNFSKYLKNRLKDLNISEREMAKKCNMSHSYLNQLIKGVNPSTNKPISPTIGMLKKLSIGLDLSVEKLQKIAEGMPESIVLAQDSNVDTMSMIKNLEKDSNEKGVIVGSGSNRVIPWDVWEDIKKAHGFLDNLGLDPSSYNADDWDDLIRDIALVIKLHAAKKK